MRLTIPMQENQVSKYAMMLATTEVGFGSMLHSFHLPFAGQILSLNQIFILSIAVYKDKCSSSFISILAAMIKVSLANGKKITPAIAIATQGVLFELGAYVSPYLGAVLSALWAYMQPVLIFLFISSGKISQLFDFYQQQLKKFDILYWAADKVLILLILGILLKCFTAIIIVKFAKHSKSKQIHRYEDLMSMPLKAAINMKHKKPSLKTILTDLFKPFYLLTILIVCFFNFQGVEGLESYIFIVIKVILNTIVLISMTQIVAYMILSYSHKFPDLKLALDSFQKEKVRDINL